MIVARRTTIVGNPKKRKRRPSARRRVVKRKSFSVKHKRRKGNPAYLMLLGPANPKRRNTVKRRRKRKNRAAGSYTKRRVVARSRRNPKRRRRSISKRQVMAFNRTHRRNRRRRSSSNPFAKSISLSRPSDLVTAGAGVLVGVFGVKTVLPFLPSSITGNPMFATAAALAIAAGEWWLLSFVSPEFGAAAGLGGIAEAASVALTNYGFPSLALGDFVPGRFVVPQNPILDAATGFPKSMTAATSAYPRPYAVA